MAADQNLTREFSHTLESQANEFDMAILVARVVNPSADPGAIRAQFSSLFAPRIDAPVTSVESLLDVFHRQGFGEHALSQADLHHSSLEWVLEHKQGIPISLAALLIEAAARHSMVSHGVNFPGHFLVSINNSLVDPLRMEVVDPAMVLQAKVDASVVRRYMQPASVQMFGLRMLNNLKAVHLHRHQFSQALDILDYQQALCGTDADLAASLQFERGEYWQQLGVFKLAAEAYRTCAATTADAQLKQQAEQRIDNIGQRAETLH